MKAILLLTSCLLLLQVCLSGQITFQKTYGDTLNQGGNSVKQCFDGGYILALTSPFWKPIYSTLIKTDANGDTLWTTYLPDFESTSVIQTRDGGYAISGVSRLDFGEMMIIKTDSIGDILWRQTYLFANSDAVFPYNQGKSLQQTQDGGYILTGVVHKLSDNMDIALIKTDFLGNVLPTSTPEKDQIHEISVYPNPFHTSTNVHFSTDLIDATLTMYSMYGEIVQSRSHIFSKEIEINREQLPAGMYFIRITQDQKVMAIEKVVITE